MTSQYEYPTQSIRERLLATYGESERLVKELERERITTISRQQCWTLERDGRFPKRKKLSERSVGWLLSDLLWFVYRGTNSFEANDAHDQ